MVALLYKIQIWAKQFAHWVTNPEGSPFVADFLVMHSKVHQSCYAIARRFKKFEFGDVNPYVEGGAREDWDPMVGTKKSNKLAGKRPQRQRPCHKPTRKESKRRQKHPGRPTTTRTTPADTAREAGTALSEGSGKAVVGLGNQGRNPAQAFSHIAV